LKFKEEELCFELVTSKVCATVFEPQMLVERFGIAQCISTM